MMKLIQLGSHFFNPDHVIGFKSYRIDERYYISLYLSFAGPYHIQENTPGVEFENDNEFTVRFVDKYEWNRCYCDLQKIMEQWINRNGALDDG